MLSGYQIGYSKLDVNKLFKQKLGGFSHHPHQEALVVSYKCMLGWRRIESSLNTF